MGRNRWIFSGIAPLGALLVTLLCASPMMGQLEPRAAQRAPGAAVAPPPISNEQLAATKGELFRLLRMSPKLTGVVANDPSLLGDLEYVGRNNPELAKFLQNHPEIARNPEFYLFGAIEGAGRGDRRLHLDRGMVFFEPNSRQWSPTEEAMKFFGVFLVFVCIFGALLWIFRVLLENRRWSRLFKAQTDIYNKLLDRFSNNEELLAYVRDDAGKRFLESLSLPSGLWSHSSGTLGRVLFPLQLGVVLTLAGLGLIWVRGSVPDATTELTGALLVFGTLTLMLGIGFIISAGLSLLLARYLGVLPPRGSAPLQNGGSNTRDSV